jgi:hypothetical protein
MLCLQMIDEDLWEKRSKTRHPNLSCLIRTARNVCITGIRDEWTVSFSYLIHNCIRNSKHKPCFVSRFSGSRLKFKLYFHAAYKYVRMDSPPKSLFHEAPGDVAGVGPSKRGTSFCRWRRHCPAAELKPYYEKHYKIAIKTVLRFQTW